MLVGHHPQQPTALPKCFCMMLLLAQPSATLGGLQTHQVTLHHVYQTGNIHLQQPAQETLKPDLVAVTTLQQ